MGIRLIVLILSAAAVLKTQIVVEDFKGCAVASVAPGAPTVVTCSNAHGYDGIAASTYVSLDSLADGSTVSAGLATWTLKSRIDNAVPGQILIESDTTHTMMNIVNGINDTGVGRGVKYSSASSAAPDCFAMNAATSSGTFWIMAKAGGPSGEAIRVSGSGGLSVEAPTLIQQIPLMVSGAAGAWAAIGSNATPRQYVALVPSMIGRVISPTQLSIPFDSTGLTWDGQAGILVRRATFSDANEFVSVNQDEGWATTEAYTANGFSVTTPTCGDPANDDACSQGFQRPENQKNYGCTGGVTISSFVVSGGVITVNLSGVYTNCPSFPSLAPGTLVWVRGGYAYTTANNPNGYPAQSAANALSSSAGGYHCLPLAVPDSSNPPHTVPSETCRGFVVQSVTTVGSQTQVTLKNNGLLDGRYTLSCADGHCPVYSTSTGYLWITWWAAPYVTINTRSGGYFSPGMGLVGYSKSGAYSAVNNPRGVNRMRTYMLSNINADVTGYVTNFQIGTYVAGQGNQVQGSQVHYYHDFDPRLYQNSWTLVEATGTPTHCVCESGNGIWPNNPTILNPYSNFTGTGAPAWSYWYGENTLYLDGPGYTTSRIGMSPTYNRFVLDSIPDEPDEWVPNRTASWSQSRYISGSLTASPGYEVSWVTAPVSNITYQVRYSTTGSLKTLGFSKGLCKNGTTACDSMDIVSVVPSGLAKGDYEYLWQSSALPAPSPTTWIGIRPIMPITWAAKSGQAYWLGSELDPMMAPGDHVTVALNGNNSGNVATLAAQPRQVWFLHVPSDPSSSSWSGLGQLSSIVAAAGTCQVNLNGVPHNLVPGWKIMVLGTSNAVLGNGGYYSQAAFYTVSAVISATQFQFSCAGVPDGTYNSDASPAAHMSVMSYPGIQIPGSSPGYVSGGTITNAEDNKNFTELVYTPPSTLPAGACDVNGDGFVNSADVDAATGGALGNKPAYAGFDLDGDGRATVIEVQRVINASRGLGCRTGQ
jgi:hypothetical protein